MLTQILRTHRFATLAFTVVLLGILAGALLGWSSKAQKQRREIITPRMVSRTSAVRIVSIEPSTVSDSLMLVKLQNTTGKDIKAYTMGSGKSWRTKNYFLSEESFAAGSTIEELIPVRTDADYKVPLSGVALTLTAVYFADGTGDGVQLFISRMADLHDGIRDQGSRILPCLRGSFQSCETEALNLPLKVDGKSSDYEEGLELARYEIMTRLTDLKNANSTEVRAKQEKVTQLFQRLAEPLQ